MIEVSPDTLRLKEIRNEIVNHEAELTKVLQRIDDLGFVSFAKTKIFTKEMDHVKDLLEQQIGHNICEDFKQQKLEKVE